MSKCSSYDLFEARVDGVIRGGAALGFSARAENKRGIHTHGYTRGLWGWFWWSVRTV